MAAAAACAAAPPPGGAAVSVPVPVRDSVLGRSVEGRPVQVARIGDPAAPVKVLVVGAIHGNETAGIAVTARLRRHPPRLPGVELWVIPTVNPDGVAAATRQNARGVDLNRNFPAAWRAQGRPGDTFYSGPRPLSEPESRLVARLVRRLHPDATIWYHQALGLVDLGTAARAAAVGRYARITGLPARRLGFLPGVATRWQNRIVPGGSAFVVELRAGALDAPGVGRHARAVAAVARYLEPARSM